MTAIKTEPWAAYNMEMQVLDDTAVNLMRSFQTWAIDEPIRCIPFLLFTSDHFFPVASHGSCSPCHLGISSLIFPSITNLSMPQFCYLPHCNHDIWQLLVLWLFFLNGSCTLCTCSSFMPLLKNRAPSPCKQNLQMPRTCPARPQPENSGFHHLLRWNLMSGQLLTTAVKSVQQQLGIKMPLLWHGSLAG